MFIALGRGEEGGRGWVRRILEDYVIIRGNEGGINCLRRSIKEGGGTVNCQCGREGVIRILQSLMGEPDQFYREKTKSSDTEIVPGIM